ncbi:hypothetical protein [Roseimicrobium sp. ORNL1]|uniref:hypothetical protein n=1 Tax=Roseimicrobium sp. ORNL1 TaxID=2711231 RepID=UPI0013E0ED65|nr:hypothetical protein [Roseimicrobium sp. ORNL1]QIF02496.1 hypothetical protein G5S37_13485 [Roseimicrobium sp. ORNL1]
MLAAFLFIACFAALVSYYIEIDSKRRDLAAAQTDLKFVQQSLISTKAQTENSRKSYEDIVAIEKLIGEKKELGNTIANLRKKRAAAVESYKKSVQDVRAYAIGTTWPEFNHGNQTLRGAKIQKITDTEVTFAHDEGVAKLNKDTLPDAVRDRFRIEQFPMLPEPPPTPEGVDANLPPPPLSNDVVPPVAVPATTAANNTRVGKLQLEIDACEQKIRTLTENRQEWLNRASSFRVQANRASNRGRPSYSFNQQALQAEQNADTIQVQIERVHKEILELKKKQLEPVSATAQ